MSGLINTKKVNFWLHN